MRTKGHHWECWLVQLNLLKKELKLQDKVLAVKLIREGLAKESVRNLKWSYNNKLKLHVSRESKREVAWLEECLEDVKGALLRLFFKFHSCTCGLFKDLGRHVKRSESQECCDCGVCKESEHVVLECASCNSQGQFFEIFEARLYSRCIWSFLLW